MRKLFITAATIALAALMTADAQGRPVWTRPDAYSKPSGGIVEKPYSGNYIRIVNAQRTVADETIKAAVLKMRMETILPFESRIGEPVGIAAARNVAESLLNEPRVGVGIVIVDDATRDIHIESAEGRWAVLNISPLKADAPDARRLDVRCAKMLWRAAARALCVGYAVHDASVLKPFASLAELDNNSEMKPSPDGSNAMLANAAGYGITPLTIASYRTACRNGWAPAPTNDVQKAIWDEIHEMPTEPIKIKPETKKVAD